MIMWADPDRAVPTSSSMARYLNIYKAAGHLNVESRVYKTRDMLPAWSMRTSFMQTYFGSCKGG
jgi:hypothetical protein